MHVRLFLLSKKDKHASTSGVHTGPLVISLCSHFISYKPGYYYPGLMSLSNTQNFLMQTMCTKLSERTLKKNEKVFYHKLDCRICCL